MDNSRLEQLLNFYSKDSSDKFIIFAIAKEYESLQNLSEALKHYEILIENHPEYIGSYYHLAKLYGEMDELDKAMDIYIRGIQKAQEQKDQHALSELQNAKLNFELENGL